MANVSQTVLLLTHAAANTHTIASVTTPSFRRHGLK
jgi:hypothetical protein